MFNSPANRAAAYRNAHVDTAVHNATPHQLIGMLFDGLLQSVRAAQGALERSELATKGEQLGRAVRILEEGLKGSLDVQRGGDVALNLRALYAYCVERLTFANMKNDAAAMAEVTRLIEPVADGWRQMGAALAAPASAPSSKSVSTPTSTSISMNTAQRADHSSQASRQQPARAVPLVSAYAQGA